MEAKNDSTAGQPTADRRRFLAKLPTVGMVAGLAGGYGAFFGMAGSYLYPVDSNNKTWLLAAHLDDVGSGKAYPFQTPTGEQVVIARIGNGRSEEDFIALSSICPHLGCRVHWQAQNDQFFCPCHNGTFSRDGAPTSGPPKTANQALLRYPLSVRGNLLFIEVDLTSLTT